MKFKYLAVAFLAVIMAFVAVDARKIVNGYVVPEASDYSGYGESFQANMAKIDTILTGAATILSSTKGADAISVTTVTADTVKGLAALRGNPDIDSCALTTVGGAARFTRSVRVSSAAGDTITAIQRLANAGGPDSIKIIIGGVTLKIACDVE
jgi:hypothetical protein